MKKIGFFGMFGGVRIIARWITNRDKLHISD